MKLKVFSAVFFCFIAFTSAAQYRISGRVLSSADSLAVVGCTVLLDDNKSIAITNDKGEFVFENRAAGNYTLLTACIGYNKETFSVAVADADVSIVLHLSSGKMLSEVAIKDKRNNFGFSHLKAVENLGIYEGKKSEVIIPDQLVANLATNNARQVYSRVAGLNIWENDGAGLQLSIGGRGLDPNRTSNFNVRQNGYDISADALGYPESYYTPPIEAVGQIQIVRGAASLQYGTQFGGLINFIIRKPVTDKKLELTARQSVGSYGFYNAFTSASGTVNKLSYYSYFQYKKGNGWRPNSDFDSYTGYANVNYQLTEKTKAGIDFTHMDYLAHQPGGLTDEMFAEDPLQSNRERNWFKVNWNLFALNIDHKFNTQNEFNLRVFGLSASRYTVGFRPNRVANPDDNSERDLIKGDFENWGAEARYLKRYSIKNVNSILLVGSRYYHGFNHSVQGFGSKGRDADFNYLNPEELTLNDYRFPNRNVSLFAENIFWLSPKFSLVPGLRYEIINTKANGFYAARKPSLDESSIELGAKTQEHRQSKRNFLIAGLGVSYKPSNRVNIYGNLSQNYRSITFSDIRIANPSAVIDPNMTDEKGYSLDLGIRSEGRSFYSYDVSAFYLNYNNRIGEYQISQGSMVLRKRTNIGQAVITGIESYAEADLLKIMHPPTKFSGVFFANAAFIKSEYKESVDQSIEGNEVEFVPGLNLKGGLRLGYKKMKASFQYSYISDQFSDATNAIDGGFAGIVGLIPSYSIMDAGISYEFKRFRIEGNVNNLMNQYYFTRRATGYPGPGIIPSDNRTFYLTLQVKL